MQPGGVGYAVPNAGASHYPPSFTNYYNPSIGQQNLGSQATASLMGGIQATPGVLAGAGALAGLGLLGSHMGMYSLGAGASTALGAVSFLDPFSLAIRGYGAGAGIAGGAGGVAAGIAGAALPAAVLYAGYKGVEAFGRGGVHQAEINRMFSGYNFANANAMGGRGFDALQMGRIGDAMHSINTSSAFISGGDAMQLTKQFQQMGLGRGADSVGDLTTKLKEFGRVADEVAQRMGTSITQVSGLIQQMRGNGFFSSSEIMGNVTNMRTMETMGVSNEQFMGAQRQGGATAMGMGLTNTAGANFMSATGGQLVSALQSGVMDREQMMRLTGTEHYADAGMAFAQKMQGSMGTFMRSGVGRALLANIGEMKDGKFTGKIDQTALSKLSSGADFDTLMDRSRQNIQGSDAGRSFMTNQDSMLNDLMGSEQGLSSMVGAVRSMASKANLGDDEDAFVLLGQRMQMGTELELRELFKFAEKQKQVRRDLLMRKAQELSTEKFQTRMARGSLSGKLSEFMGNVSDTIVAPIEHAGANFFTGGSRMFEELNMEIGETITGVSRNRTLVTQSQVDSLNRRMTAGEKIRAGSGPNLVVTGIDTGEINDGYIFDSNRDAGALGATNGRGAIMLQRAAASKSYDVMDELLGSSLSKSAKSKLDRITADAASDDEITRLMGAARQAKLSGDKDELGYSMHELTQALKSKGYASTTHEMQYLVSKLGGSDVVARDIANAEISTRVVEGMSAEEKDFKDAMLGDNSETLSATSRALGGMALRKFTGARLAGGLTARAGGFLIGRVGGAAIGRIGGMVLGRAAGAAIGAQIGATVGSAVPIVGTVIGLAAGALIGWGVGELMKSDEEKTLERIMDKGEGVDLMGSLKSPKEMAEFNQLLEEYKTAYDDEDEAYEAAAKAFSDKYGKKVTANDVRTTDKAMEHMSGKDSYSRSKMSIEELSRDEGLKKLMGYTRFQADTKARTKMNQEMLDTVTKQKFSGIEGEASFLAALKKDEGDSKQAAMDAAMRKMIKDGVSKNITATSDDPLLKQAVAAAVTTKKTISGIEENISEEELAKKLNASVEDIRYFRDQIGGGTGLVTKSELDQLGDMLSENAFRGVSTRAVAGEGMAMGGEFSGNDAELQSESLKKTAFMIDALYAKATGATTATTDGGQRILTNMNNKSKPDGPV